MPDYYCVYQEHPGVVFGIGCSAEEAEEDAKQWTDDGTLYGLITVRCTEKVYAYVKETGGAGKFQLFRGCVELIDEDNEE